MSIIHKVITHDIQACTEGACPKVILQSTLSKQYERLAMSVCEEEAMLSFSNFFPVDVSISLILEL